MDKTILKPIISREWYIKYPWELCHVIFMVKQDNLAGHQTAVCMSKDGSDLDKHSVVRLFVG